MSTKLIDAFTILTGVCALFVAGVVLQRSNSPPTLAGEDRRITDWELAAQERRAFGPDEAAITILYYGDYECPACRSLEPHLRAVLSRYRDDVKVVYRHFPLRQHRLAYPAARAAECARAQGKFLAFHQRLYDDDQWLLDPKNSFTRYATEVGVDDPESYEFCLEQDGPNSAIEEDIGSTAALGLTGTPSVIINGLLVARRDSARLIHLVERLLTDQGLNDA